MPLSRANGVDIWYEVTGEGPALVLIHANPFDHDLWMYQTAHFFTWFKVVGIDIRGYGRSEKVTTAFALKDMCNDVIGAMALIDDVLQRNTNLVEVGHLSFQPLETCTSVACNCS